MDSIETSPLTMDDTLGRTFTSMGYLDSFLSNSFFFDSDIEGIAIRIAFALRFLITFLKDLRL